MEHAKPATANPYKNSKREKQPLNEKNFLNSANSAGVSFIISIYP